MRASIDSNVDSIISQLSASGDNAIRAAVSELTNTAYEVESEAKENIKRNKTVDTGRLLGSITTEIKDSGVNTKAEVGTNVEYANYIEYGTSKMGAKPFLIPAFMSKTNGLEDRIRQAVRDAFR